MIRLLVPSFIIVLLCSGTAIAEPKFSIHKDNILKIEKAIKGLDLEVSGKEKEKRSIRDAARREEVLQRIIEIHSELISLRSDLDHELRHIRGEHFKDGQKSNILAEVKNRQSRRRPSSYNDPIRVPMDLLFRKIQSKYASFLLEIEEEDEDFSDLKRIEKTQRGKRRTKEAGSYLRKKSRVKISK